MSLFPSRYLLSELLFINAHTILRLLFTLMCIYKTLIVLVLYTFCHVCRDDFTSTQMRRGRGATVTNFGFTVPLPAGGDGAQYSDPSGGWRSDVDGVAQIANRLWLIYQGPPNWWIDTVTGELKQATVAGAPTASTGYRDSTDPAGPLWWRDQSVYTKGKLLTTTNVLNGVMGGSYFIYENAGISSNFEEFSISFAPYEGGVGAAVGVVFNYQYYNTGSSYYAIMLRNCATEVGIGLYKVTVGAATATALQKSSSFTFVNNAGTATTMNANGARIWTRLYVSKDGGRIQAWLNNPNGTVLAIDFTDSSPLPAGNVGIHTIGMPAIAFDNVWFQDSPTCTDGILNQDEEGVDCGGPCSTNCVYPGQYAWDFTNDGYYGWTHETYGDNPNGNVSIPLGLTIIISEFFIFRILISFIASLRYSFFSL